MKKQESDCISRQAVLEKIKEVCFSKEWAQFRVDNGSNGQRDFLINYIEQLSSVEPQPRKGYWIRWYEEEETDCGTEYDPHCKCSECGTEYDPHTSIFIHFCSNCGVELEENPYME